MLKWEYIKILWLSADSTGKFTVLGNFPHLEVLYLTGSLTPFKDVSELLTLSHFKRNLKAPPLQLDLSHSPDLKALYVTIPEGAEGSPTASSPTIRSTMFVRNPILQEIVEMPGLDWHPDGWQSGTSYDRSGRVQATIVRSVDWMMEPFEKRRSENFSVR